MLVGAPGHAGGRTRVEAKPRLLWGSKCHCTLNKFISIPYTRNTLWANGTVEHYAGEVTGSNPVEANIPTKLLTSHQVPCGEILLGQHPFRTDACSLWIGPYN